MVVYSVRGLEPGDVSSLRSFLDKELGDTNRKLLARKSKEAAGNGRINISTRMDIDMGEMIDVDELYEFLAQDYFLEMSRKNFLKRVENMDRDETRRLRARDVRAMLHETIIAKAEKLHKEMSHDAAIANGVLTPGAPTPSSSVRSLRPSGSMQGGSSQTGSLRRVRRNRGSFVGVSARNLKVLMETSAPQEVTSILKGPGSKKHQQRHTSNCSVLYTVQTLGVLEEIQKQKFPDSDSGPEITLSSKDGQENRELQENAPSEPPALAIVLPGTGGSPGPSSPQSRLVTQRGNYRAKLRAAAYDYGPRVSNASGDGVASPLPDRTLRLPPPVSGSGNKNSSDPAGNRFYQDETWADAVRAELGIVTKQTYLTAPNHSSRPTTSQTLRPTSIPASRPSTCPHQGPRQLPGTPQTMQPMSPYALSTFQLDHERPSTVPTRVVQETKKPTQGFIRPMSRYKSRQAETLLLKDYKPSRGELRLGWTPNRDSQTPPVSPTKKQQNQRIPLGTAMMSDIRVKERPVSNRLNIKLQAFHQVRQSEARSASGGSRRKGAFAVEAW